MDAALEHLIHLQKVDGKIKTLKDQSDGIPKQIASLDSKLNRSREKVEKIKKTLKNNELQIRKNESAIEESRQQQGHYRGQLFKLKSNREYQALKSEIDGLDSKISSFETDILEILEDTDNQKIALKKAEKSLASEILELNMQKNDLKIELDAVLADLNDCEKDFAETTSEIPEEHLARYTRIKTKRGSAVAEIVSGNCGGCYMKVRPQFSAMVRSNSELLQCEKCGRYLYWSDVSE